MARDRVHRPIENHRRGAVLIDGLPAYMKGKVPDGLATQNQLDRRGLRRGVDQRPAGWLWYRSGPGGYRGGPHTWRPPRERRRCHVSMVAGPSLLVPYDVSVEAGYCSETGWAVALAGDREKPGKAALSWGSVSAAEVPGGDADPHPGAQRATHRHWPHKPTRPVRPNARVRVTSHKMEHSRRSGGWA
jgi:hypothetical protein